MLFEFILNDYNIPEAIKAQLGRLQIPLLRAALLGDAWFDGPTWEAEGRPRQGVVRR